MIDDEQESATINISFSTQNSLPIPGISESMTKDVPMVTRSTSKRDEYLGDDTIDCECGGKSDSGEMLQCDSQFFFPSSPGFIN